MGRVPRESDHAPLWPDHENLITPHYGQISGLHDDGKGTWLGEFNSPLSGHIQPWHLLPTPMPVTEWVDQVRIKGREFLTSDDRHRELARAESLHPQPEIGQCDGVP
jgi:hypothetical protein